MTDESRPKTQAEIIGKTTDQGFVFASGPTEDFLKPMGAGYLELHELPGHGKPFSFISNEQIERALEHPLGPTVLANSIVEDMGQLSSISFYTTDFQRNINQLFVNKDKEGLLTEIQRIQKVARYAHRQLDGAEFFLEKLTEAHVRRIMEKALLSRLRNMLPNISQRLDEMETALKEAEKLYSQLS